MRRPSLGPWLAVALAGLVLAGCGHGWRNGLVRQPPQAAPIPPVPAVAEAPVAPQVVVMPPAPEVPPPPVSVPVPVECPPPRPERDATAGRAADYGRLVGELHYLYVRDVWRLRYAGADEDDRYGGSVTLTGTGPMTGYRSGQRVRVEGQLLDPDSREPSPAYRVHSLRPVP